MFFNSNKMVNIDLSSFNTEDVTDMRSMLGYCSQLENIDLSSFNTENVTNMSCMFSHCNILINLELSSFNKKMSVIWMPCFGVVVI